MPKKIGLVDDSLTIRTAFGLTFAGEDLGLQAQSYLAKPANELKLCDEIMSPTDALLELVDLASK